MRNQQRTNIPYCPPHVCKTVTLSNGVPIETVSKMLGHTNLKTTQHYAKILDKKISEDMQVLKAKFNTNLQTQSKSINY